MSSPCPGGRSRPPATSTCCCSTRPAPSRWATVRRPTSSRPTACGSRPWPTPLSFFSGRRDARRPQHRGSGQRALRPARARHLSELGVQVHSLLRSDQDERRGFGRAGDPQRVPPTPSNSSSADQGGSVSDEVKERWSRSCPQRRHAAGGCRRAAGSGRYPSQGRRQRRHPRALRRTARYRAFAR